LAKGWALDLHNSKQTVKSMLPDLLDLFFLVWLLVALRHFSVSLFSWSGKAGGLLTELSFLCGVVGYLKLRGQTLHLLRLGRVQVRALLPTIAFSLGAIILLDELERLVVQFAPLPEGASEALTAKLSFCNSWEMTCIFGGAVAAAAIVEEMVFRGVFQGALAPRVSPTAAVLITSLVFASIHFQPSWFIQLLIFSVLAGYMAWRANSLIPPMIFHALSNLWTVIVLLNLLPSVMQIYLWRGHVHPVMLLTAYLLFSRGYRWFNLTLERGRNFEEFA